MLRAGAGLIARRLLPGVGNYHQSILQAAFSAKPDVVDSMPYLHHGTRPRFRGYPKFKSPRKRASGLLKEITEETIRLSKEAKPEVWDVPFKVADAIEFEVVAQGGVQSEDIEKIRGVVLGIYRKRLDHTVLIRDVVYGEPIERLIPLHSPLIKSLRIIEENFVFKGKRKVKRAKLYYLRGLNPTGTSFIPRLKILSTFSVFY